MNKKMLVVLVVVMMASVLLSACGGDGGKVIDGAKDAWNGCGDITTCVQPDTYSNLADATCSLTGGTKNPYTGKCE